MFAQPVTYQSYDNEPVRIASSLSLGRGVCLRHFFSVWNWNLGHWTFEKLNFSLLLH